MRRGLVFVLGLLWNGLALGGPAAAAAQRPGSGQAAGARPPVPGAPAGVTAFVGVNVVPMDAERVLANQTVLIQNGWIMALGPATQVKVPAGAARVDGQGQYLIPGLADMHAPLREVSEGALGRFVVHGVTTVRNMDHSSSKEFTERVLQLRARAAAGELLSPRIYTSGVWPAYGRPADRPANWGDIAPAEVAQRLAAYKAAGYDFVKPYDMEPQSRVVYDSLAAAARRLGLPLAGHVPDVVPLPVALTTMKSIEHLYGIIETQGVSLGGLSREATSAEIAALAGAVRRAGVWNCPTALIKSGFKSQLPEIAQQSFQFIKALQDSGAGLLLGADSPGGGPLGLAIHRELEVLVQEAGLTPYQALVTGTRNVAAYFGTLDSTGTVAVGKRADLVLLRGNPLQDIRYTREPVGVMLGGRWLDRAALDGYLSTSPSARTTAFDGLFGSVFWLRGMGRTGEAALKTHRARLGALNDSLALAGRGERARLAGRVAEELGALRATLPAEDGGGDLRRDIFDPAARVWLREQARQGTRVTIPGVMP
jgi:imidazolonepropionase-like amidohydrolase